LLQHRKNAIICWCTWRHSSQCQDQVFYKQRPEDLETKPTNFVIWRGGQSPRAASCMYSIWTTNILHKCKYTIHSH